MNPSRLALNVPPAFRRGVPVPKVLRLHFGSVPGGEQQALFGVPVTSVLRTIIDVWEDGPLSKTALRQAFEQGKSSGKTTRKQALGLLRDSRLKELAQGLKES